MRILLLSKSKKAHLGLSLAGVHSIVVTSTNQAESEWDNALENEEIGMILLDKFVYDSIYKKVHTHEQTLEFPLVIVIPTDEKDTMMGDNLSKVIKETLGIKV